MANVNKVLGAIGLTLTSGSLTRIPSDVMSNGDIAFVATSDSFYIFKCHDLEGQSVISSSTPPFSAENPPLWLMPEDNINTTKRWKLVSINTLTNDVQQEIGKYLKTSKIKCYSDFSIEDINGDDVLSVNDEGEVWIKNLTIDSTNLVENLNAETVTDIHGDNIMTLDGNRSFLNPVSGAEPTRANHIATKNYVDNKVDIIDGDRFMKKDGTTAFLAPTAGVNPINDYHIATKIYVDTEIEEKLETFNEGTNQITYKNGVQDIPNNATEVEVIFGGTLDNYSVHPSIMNTVDDDPAAFMLTVVEQSTSRFTVSLNGNTDSSNYKLSWMVIAL